MIRTGFIASLASLGLGFLIKGERFEASDAMVYSVAGFGLGYLLTSKLVQDGVGGFTGEQISGLFHGIGGGKMTGNGLQFSPAYQGPRLFLPPMEGE